MTTVEANQKAIDRELKICLNNFDNNTLDDQAQITLRQKISKLYDLRGIKKFEKQNYLAAMNDYTKSLEYWKIESAYINRAHFFQKFGFPSLALKDIMQAIQINPANENSIQLKNQLEKELININAEDIM